MAGGPNFNKGADVKNTPEKQMAKLRENARSGGTGGGGHSPERTKLEAPVTPGAVSLPGEPFEPPQKGINLELAPDVNDADMEELLGILQRRGFTAAIKELDRLNNPHLEDDFHRLLVQYKADGHDIPGLDPKSPTAKALDFVLLAIQVPETKPGSPGSSLKEIGARMEFLLQQLIPFVPLPEPIFFKDLRRRHAIQKEHFTFEIAVSHSGEAVVFYMAVARQRRDSVEKLIFAQFPGARILEKKDDYNIFNQFGVSKVGFAHFYRPAPLPIKTMEEFDSDPLNAVLAAMSRVSNEGEGVAIQINVAPGGEYYTKRFRAAQAEIAKGKKTTTEIFREHQYLIRVKFWRRAPQDTVKAVGKALEDKKDKKDTSNVDNIQLELVNKKLKSIVSGVNLRIAVSARTQARCEQLFSDIDLAFGQFENTQGNRFKFREPKTNRGKRELMRAFIFRLFDRGPLEGILEAIYNEIFEKIKSPMMYYSPAIPMNLTELATLFHFSISGTTTSREAQTAGAKHVPAPLGLPTTGILLGKNNYSNIITDIRFAPEDRLRHLYVIGQTGTGKTTFLKNMILQDIENGEGVCFIDPHGPDVLNILSRIPKERYDDVIYFDPAYMERPMGLNMLEYDVRFPEQKTFVVDEMFKIFKKLYGDVPEAFGPIFEQYFRNATMLVLEDPETGSTLMDISRVLADEEFRHLKLSRCRNPVIAHFWEDIAENVRGEGDLRNVVPYITSKFDIFIANEIMRPIIGQQRSAFNFQDIMDNRKILLVNLSKGRLGDVNSNLLGLVLVGKIMMTALARDLTQNPPPFYLYLDEFQNITTDTIAIILSEARKFKLSMTMAHQFIAQLQPRTGIKEAVFGNVGTMCVFRVGPEDAEFLQKQMEPVFTSTDMLRIENYHAYLKMLAGGSPKLPFSMSTPDFAAGDPITGDALKQLSYQRYGRNRESVEAEIREKYGNIR